MQEDMRMTTLGGAAGERERPWHSDIQGVVDYVEALADRVDRVEARQALAAYPTVSVRGVDGTPLYEVPTATRPAPREPAIAREIGRILAGPGQPRQARDAVVRTAVADLQRALGLLPDGRVGDQTLVAVAALHAGLGTPVVDGAKTR